MKERPIPLTAWEVQAVLAGRKTQTRRVVNWNTASSKYQSRGCFGEDGFDTVTDRAVVRHPWRDGAHIAAHLRCPYGQPGERLWVRESFWVPNETCDHEYCSGCDLGSTLRFGKGVRPEYVATPECLNPPKVEHEQTVALWNAEPIPGDWWLAPPDDWDGESEEDHTSRGVWVFHPEQFFTKHSSAQMPRWASRILLEVVSVRVERVRDITEADAIAEGLEYRDGYWCSYYGRGFGNPCHAYADLWNHINSEGSWELNPWTWVVTFRRIIEVQP